VNRIQCQGLVEEVVGRMELSSVAVASYGSVGDLCGHVDRSANSGEHKVNLKTLPGIMMAIIDFKLTELVQEIRKIPYLQSCCLVVS